MPSDPFLDARSPLRPKSAVAAIIVVNDAKYLLQHRDPNPEIFFPDHWSFFGGAAEGDETPLETIARELDEELGLRTTSDQFEYFSKFRFDLEFAGGAPIDRLFYVLRLASGAVADLRVREGQGLMAATPRQALSELRMTPYDAFALWLHHERSRLVF